MTERQRLLYRRPWRIELSVRDGVQRLLPDTELARTIDRALVAADAPSPATIGLILTDDREISGLNETHMGHDGATDVLSFPLIEPEVFSSARPVAPVRRLHLGEIVVSVQRAIEQAESGRGGQTGHVRWSPQDELRLLVTHGVLHVCGWDHATPSEEREMRALEERLLGAVVLRPAASRRPPGPGGTGNGPRGPEPRG